MVAVKRAYEPPDDSDGQRILVDRLWPRGLSKQQTALRDWLREVAPSDDLRRWYGHDPQRFAEFADRYRAELHEPQRAMALEQLRSYVGAGPVTLITATRELAHAHTAVLVVLLTERA